MITANPRIKNAYRKKEASPKRTDMLSQVARNDEERCIICFITPLTQGLRAN